MTGVFTKIVVDLSAAEPADMVSPICTRVMVQRLAAKLDEMLPVSMVCDRGFMRPVAGTPGMSREQVEIQRLRSLNIQERGRGDDFQKLAGHHQERAEKAEAALAAVTRRHDGDSYERLAKAAIALYRAGHWTADIAASDQARLWADLRDALGLPVGGSNKPAVTITNTPHPWRD